VRYPSTQRDSNLEIAANKRLQTHALDCAVPGVHQVMSFPILKVSCIDVTEDYLDELKITAQNYAVMIIIIKLQVL